MMNNFFSIKNKLKKFSISFIFFSLFTYFCYHAINGNRGIIALFRLTRQVEKSSSELDNLKTERLYLEHKVNSLSANSLDLDLVDEQARKLLGYAKENEKIYFIE